MRSMNAIVRSVALLSAVLLVQGCATNLRKPASAPQPAAKKLSTFQAFQMKHVSISPAFAAAAANQKAAKKIDENLFSQMRMVMPSLQESDGAAQAGTLLIEPVVEEIKFIGGFARFMMGAMAGSSAVLMKVTYTDGGTGEVLAAPEFYRAANAMSGGYSIGGTDNMMLDEIAREIANYTKLNM